MNEKSKLKLKELMSGDKFRNILIILLIVSVGVIFVSSQFDSMDTKTHESTFDTEAYRESVTEELYSMVTSISGVGEAKVRVETLERLRGGVRDPHLPFHHVHQAALRRGLLRGAAGVFAG